MSESKTRNFMLALNGIAIISAILMIISLFFRFTIFGETAKTGFELFRSENTASVIFVLLTLILAIAIIIFGILRILGKVDRNMFGIIFAISGIILIVFSVVMFITMTNVTFAGIEEEFTSRGIGSVLHLIFSIIAGLASVGAFALETIRN